MEKIINLVVTNSLSFAFPIKFNLKEFKGLKPEYRGNSKSEFQEYLLTNVFENTSLFAKEVQKLDNKPKSKISVELFYKKFILAPFLRIFSYFGNFGHMSSFSYNYIKNKSQKLIKLHMIMVWNVLLT